MYDTNERRYLLGLMFSVKKRYETAIRYFKVVISEDPLFFKKNIDYYDLLPLEIKLLLKTELHL